MPRLAQETLIPLWELKNLKGIDNVTTDDLRLDPGFVRVANNVDIDTEMMARRRKGILRALLNGSAHSGWSDEDKLCFLVLDGNLIQLNLDWTTTTLLSDVGSTKMHFVKLGDRVFFANLEKVGYIQNSVAHAFSESVRAQRQRMVGGELIEYFDGSLYIAQGEFVYRSISGDPSEMDLENNSIHLGGQVTMMTGINGPGGQSGMYVSGGGKCIYLSNLLPNIYDATWKNLLDVPALPGSAIKIEKMDLGKGVVGQCVIWATIIGIFMGLAGGYVRDLTGKHYAVKDIEQGASLARWYNGYRQYIFMGQAPAEISGVEGTGILPSLEGEGKTS